MQQQVLEKRVRTIPPTVRPENVQNLRPALKRVAAYCRVSTKQEEQLNSYETQVNYYTDRINREPGWKMAGIYADKGITGTSMKKRDDFKRMIAACKRGRIDTILTKSLSRFARNTVDTLVITRELKDYGIEVYFVSDNIWTMDGDGELRLTIMATLAQEESRKISERVRAGQAVSRENGVLYGNGNIIGYDRVGGTYVINPEQAETIRMVFELYSQGLGEKEVVNELTRRGRKDGHGNVKWSCVKISRILRNATYMGYIGYNKSKVNNFLEKKRIKNLDESTFILKKGDFEPFGGSAKKSERAGSVPFRCLLVRNAGRAQESFSTFGCENFAAAAAQATTDSNGGFYRTELLSMGTSAITAHRILPRVLLRRTILQGKKAVMPFPSANGN